MVAGWCDSTFPILVAQGDEYGEHFLIFAHLKVIKSAHGKFLPFLKKYTELMICCVFKIKYSKWVNLLGI
jgi:hypothetical protein